MISRAPCTLKALLMMLSIAFPQVVEVVGFTIDVVTAIAVMVTVVGGGRLVYNYDDRGS
jgi:hydrogenase-4 membrane subunit HyfE